MSRRKKQIGALGKLGCAAGLAAVTSIASATLVPPQGLIDGDEGVGDFVFNDINMNGVWDELEPGISGVTVNLLTATGDTQFKTTSTDSSGFYQFSSTFGDCSQQAFCFSNTEWIIEFILPTNYVFTTQNVGDNDLIDSDALQSGVGIGRTHAFTVNFNKQYNIDAGMYRDAQVPVPATLALFGLGLAGLGWSRHKKA